ncbi:MAG: HD domain-containing phosphohydrolase [Thermodesulfobacteriota bacterium]
MNPDLQIPEQLPVLIVDDEVPITEMISQALRRVGYKCHTAHCGEEAIETMAREPVDVVITDIRMPGMSGVDLLKKIKSDYGADVIVMTGFTEDYNYESIITAGASDFIQKPISFRELIIRLKRVLRMRYLLIERDAINRELQENVEKLETYSVKLKNAHGELEYAYLDTINRLVAAAEYKDEDTGDHIVRMSRYSALVAEKLGLPAETVKLIRYASPMHDIGKIGIPDRILLKPERLTEDEFETIKSHTTIGAAILANSKAEVLKMACEIARSHHEKWNGQGYPNGLSKTDIPISGRIVCIADTFDALTSKRPYKSPYPIEVALDIIKAEREKQFDPDIVDAFVGNMDEIHRIRDEVGRADDISLADFLWSDRDRVDGIDKQIRGGQPFADRQAAFENNEEQTGKQNQ